LKRSEVLEKIFIKPTDIVLEIGPGNMPYHRSDIFLEKDIYNNSERAGDLKLTRPTIVGDAHNIPLKDKSIDYIFCAQVLEHSDDPECMLKELMRVGKKGYIETPNSYREMMFGWPFHKWIVELEENKLVLYRNKLPQYFGRLFHDLQDSEYSFQLFINEHFEKFNTIFEWEDSIIYEIKDYEDLINKYQSEETYYIKHDSRNSAVNYDGILTIGLFLQCIPFLRKWLPRLFLLKSLLQRRFKKRVVLSPEAIVDRMRCHNCGDYFRTESTGHKYICKSCDNNLTVNGLLINNSSSNGE